MLKMKPFTIHVLNKIVAVVVSYRPSALGRKKSIHVKTIQKITLAMKDAF